MSVEAERLAGKVFLVTGATSGLGLATAMRLATEGAEVIGTAREGRRAEQAIEAVPPVLQPRLRFEVADHSSLRQIRALGERLAESLGRLDEGSPTTRRRRVDDRARRSRRRGRGQHRAVVGAPSSRSRPPSARTIRTQRGSSGR